jgi:polyisoprenoid-binding protein YceI
MKHTGIGLAAAAALGAVGAPAGAQAQEWELDRSHSTVEFTVRHMMVSEVRGEFKDFSVALQANERDVTKSSLSATIPVSGIHTRDEKRDGHLKSADFFDAEKYPEIKFTSKAISKAGKGKLKMKGDLTIRGVTKEVVLDLEAPAKPVKSPWGTEVYGVQATGKLNRKDFGLTWNKTLDGGGILVGDEVRIVINVEFIKKPPEPVKAGGGT